MAKTATVDVTESAETPHDPLEGIDAVTVEEANQAFAITDELRGTAGITLQFTRVWPNTPGVVGHCGEMAAEEYSLAESLRRYGPGRYVVRLRGPDNRYMRGGGKLNLAGNPSATLAQPAQSGSVGGEVVQLLEAMNRRQDDQQRAAEARREKMWALALAAMPVVPAIIAAMKGGGGDLTTALITALKPAPQMTPADMVNMMSQLKEMSGGGDKADPIDQLSKLLTVARDLGDKGDGGAGSNWLDLLRDGLKAAPDLLAGLQRSGPQTQTVQVAPHAPQPNPVQIPTEDSPAIGGSATPPQGADMWILIQPILKDAAVKLERWAKENRNAEIYADVLYDDLPGWLVERLNPAEALAMLNNPQWWEHLTAFHPPLAQYRKWLDGMRAELIELVKEQIAAAETLAPSPHDGEE